MQQSDTTDKILQAAASLFAEQGFNDTTLRQITARADVNLAAVNYHFGSKERLIMALADACIEPLVQQLERVLAERLALAPQRLTLDELMDMLMRTLLQAQRRSSDELSVFMRSISPYFRSELVATTLLLILALSLFSGKLPIFKSV
jgi:AcrR family transcriptional regulator